MIQPAQRLQTVKEYYFSRKLKEVRQLVAGGNPVINMGIGSPDLQPPEVVVEALAASVTHKGAHQYQSYQGIPDLRQAMARYYARHFKVKPDPDREVLPLMGSKEGIMHISMAFLNSGDEVLIPNPGYPTYEAVTRLAGGIPRSYSLTASGSWLPDLEALSKESLSRVKLMWVNYPHMPTGALASKADFEALVSFAKHNQIVLVNDNPYGHILNDYPQSILNVQGAMEVALELNSISKTFNMAGWRIGMLIGNETHLKSVLQVKSNMDSGMFYGLQRGAIAALESGDSWFKELNSTYGERRNLMWQFADKLGCTYDKNTAGMFVWAGIPRELGSSNALSDRLLYEKNIFAAPGTVFGNMGEGFIRFSLCISKELIEEAIERL